MYQWYRIASSNKKSDLKKFAKFVFVKGTWIVAKNLEYGNFELFVDEEEAKYWLAQDPTLEPKCSELRFWQELKVWNGSILTHMHDPDYYVKTWEGVTLE